MTPPAAVTAPPIGRAERHLAHDPALDRAADGEQRGAGLVGRTELAEPVRPVPGDQGDVGERLGVLDQRRTSADPSLEGSGRGERRLGDPAVHEVDERRLLTRDVARRQRDATDERTVQLRRVSGLDRPVHARQRPAAGPVDRDDDLVGADRLRGEHRAVEHEVGQRGQQEAVLGAQRLALGAVHHDDRPSPVLGDGPHLAARREGRAAAAAEPRRLDRVDQWPAVSVRTAPRRPSVLGDVLLQPDRPVRPEAREQARQPLGAGAGIGAARVGADVTARPLARSGRRRSR